MVSAGGASGGHRRARVIEWLPPSFYETISMTTLLFYHPAFLEHDTGVGHPESPERLRAILKALEADDFITLERREAPPASGEQLQLVHPESYVSQVLSAIPKTGYMGLDVDTIASPGSGEAALRAAGAICAAVDAIMAEEGDNAFCAVRPPGHHAEPTRSMGFCLFNNIAVGALHARVAHGLKKVAVIDFDVHHGNGTEGVFWDDADLFYGSTHQWPHYPGSGAKEDRGIGNIFNEPLPAGSGGEAFRAAYGEVILPALDAFAPEFVFISAGFDAHADDPLASLSIHETDYAWVTMEMMDIASRHSSARIVSALEGGYNLAALAASVSAHIKALMGES